MALPKGRSPRGDERPVGDLRPSSTTLIQPDLLWRVVSGDLTDKIQASAAAALQHRIGVDG